LGLHYFPLEFGLDRIHWS